ncbi:unnamed protein product [Ambrosiozyma monospora]|uniref:Unnamed protein product n=1 Tax=Ambrosiozyma monospora TaxID=43982 RepID=A0ACB5T2E5_AMBMO|nr:unnamed protein product [Ambrosiozyma monospora]
MPPKRLDSITRPTSSGAATGSKPALKFKPKVVARKTKEEREASKTVHKPGINRKAHQHHGPKPKPGGKRIPKHLQNTTIVSSGPLSSGAVSLGGSTGASHARMRNNSPVPDFLKKLKDGEKGPKKIKSLGGDYDDDDDEDNFIADDDTARINMSKEYQWDEADTEFFPVRAERIEHHEYGEEPTPDKSIKTEFHRASSVIPSEPETREASVKPEEVKLENAPGGDLSEFVNFEVLEEVDNSSTKQESSEEAVNSINGYQERQESKRLKEDYESILSYLRNTKLDTDTEEEASHKRKNDSYMFVQLPDVLPTFKDPNSSVKPEVKQEDDVSRIYSDKENKIPDGIIGSLRYHKSGKITMKIGNAILDVTRGGTASFVQDVIVVNEEEKKFFDIGHINEKIIATPQFL